MPEEAERDLLLFEELVARHTDMVFHVALAWCRDRGEAEESTQVALIKAGSKQGPTSKHGS